MATRNPPKSAGPNKIPANGAKTISAARRTPPGTTTPPAIQPVIPVQEVVRRLFETDAAVRGVIAENLKARNTVAQEFTVRANEAFAKFTPTKYPDYTSARSNYVKPGESLAPMQTEVIKRGIEALQNSERPRGLKLRGGVDLKALMKDAPPNAESLVATIELPDLIPYLEARIAAPLFAARDVYTICKAEADADKRMKEIANSIAVAPVAPAAGVPAVAPVVAKGNGGDASHLTAAKMVTDSVDLQMTTATSPESQLVFSIPDHSEQAQGVRSIPTFELRKGASDVTSYHDFHNLQIAFEDIWTEMFDGQVTALGKQLYEEYVRTKSFIEGDGGQDQSVKTIDDLRSLMNDIRDFSRLTESNVPGQTHKSFLATITGNLAPGLGTSSGEATKPSDPLGGSSRLTQLLDGLDKVLSEKKYAFDVFVPDSVNFGILITYRQRWVPQNYQVGDLVSTIPLAPKELWRYTTKKIVKKTRATKEIDDSLQIRKSESVDTSRVDAEIVEKTLNKNSFNITAKESIGGGDTIPYTVESTQTANTESSKESQKTKKDFRESVLKSAQEYKQEHRLEIDTSQSTETEDTTFHEIQNPNDELAVTYLFYELQRTYEISEKLHKLTPVIFVANDVPAPHEINDAWLLQHDWILRHAILDDSFRPALEYLTKSLVGAELNIRILEDNALLQKGLVDKLSQQMQSEDQVLAHAQEDIRKAVQDYAGATTDQGIFTTIKSVFDPLGITGKPDTGNVTAAQSLLDYAKDTLDRAEKEKQRLDAQLATAVTALQSAVNSLSVAVKEHYNNLTELDRLRVHVKDNILYYMQAIWSHEPPDQRFFRLYNKDVPMITPESTGVAIKVYEVLSALHNALDQSGQFQAAVPMPNVTFSAQKLEQVADLDNMLGFKGNYMIFPMKQNNYLTLHMMQDYLDVGDEVKLRDPDEFGNYTIDELQELAQCVYRRDRTVYDKHKDEFRRMIIDRLSSSRTESELVIVPTTSLYIEALVGTHPLLEDFKLIHRALDVKKVQAEVRHAELENTRLASRVMKGKDGDPDVEKKIVIETGDKSVTIQPDGN
jgi:hypothetical protein